MSTTAEGGRTAYGSFIRFCSRRNLECTGRTFWSDTLRKRFCVECAEIALVEAFDASKGGIVSGITEDHRFIMCEELKAVRELSDAKMRVAREGERITTRYFGGYENVRVLQTNDTYYVVSRFGGQGRSILPKNAVEKIFDADNNMVFDAPSPDIHPALRTHPIGGAK